MMPGSAGMSSCSKSALRLSLAAAVFGLSACGTAGDFWDSLPDASSSGSTQASEVSGEDKQALIDELAALRAELKKRSGRLQSDLAALKAELVRRQAAGEISQEKVNLSPAQIRDEQLSQLEALKAELERRRTAKNLKQQIITQALTQNEAAYSSIDQCLSSSADFRQAFKNRSDLNILVSEKDNQVYRNADRSLLILTSKENCDVSFSGGNLDDYAVGLTHVLETQGGVVESKSVAGLNVLSVAHPRGNFRLASGRKVIGGGGNTNLYTTISVVN